MLWERRSRRQSCAGEEKGELSGKRDAPLDVGRERQPVRAGPSRRHDADEDVGEAGRVEAEAAGEGAKSAYEEEVRAAKRKDERTGKA